MTPPDPRPIPPPPFRCAREGCPEPVTSWARDDFAGFCSEGCRDLVEEPPAAAPDAVPLCPLCLAKIGGAAGAPDFPYRAAEDFERCGAGDCETGKTNEEDPYICRKCGNNEARTIEVGEASAVLDMDLGRTDCSATEFPEGVETWDVDWVTVGVYCPACMTEIRDSEFEAEPLVFALRKLFVLASRAPKEDLDL